MITIKNLSLYLLIINLNLVFSQKKRNDSITTKKLSEVILTATKRIKKITSVPYPVSIVSNNEIKNLGAVRLNEILNEQTGIFSVSDESGFEGIQIQGISSEYVMVLIDGFPVIGRKSGNLDLKRFTLNNVERIEILKGPSSSLYGSEAIGGVINIITKKINDKSLNGNTSFQIDSYSDSNFNVNFRNGLKKIKYEFNGNGYSSKGYDINPNTSGKTISPFRNFTLNNNIYYNFNDDLSLRLKNRFAWQDQDLEKKINDINFIGSTIEKDLNINLRVEQKLIDKIDIIYDFYFTKFESEESIDNQTSINQIPDNFFNQDLFRPELRINYLLSQNLILSSGVGVNYDKLERSFFDENVSFNSQYVYSQIDLNIKDKIKILLGGRFDNHSEYKDQFSPKFGVKLNINQIISVKGSIGYGFKSPDFRQLYFNFTNSTIGYSVLGNKVAERELEKLKNEGQIINIFFSEKNLYNELKPESSIGYNLGVEFKNSKWNFDFNIFRNDISDLIDTRVIARKKNGQNVFGYFNFDNIVTQGFELNYKYKLSTNLTFNLGYQYLLSFDKEKKESLSKGEIFGRDKISNKTIRLKISDYFGLENRSKHNLNFKIYYNSNKFNMTTRFLYKSKYALFDSNGNGLIDVYDDSFINGYVISNISIGKDLNEKINIQLGMNNLIDHTDQNIPGLRGFSGFIKLNYQFNNQI
tara:strand:+ start:189 stop:2279 length:2091 start_codon:yes stop_codon:yes gene_type:complete